jgi:Peptidase propeptide and YPEB domain
MKLAEIVASEREIEMEMGHWKILVSGLGLWAWTAGCASSQSEAEQLAELGGALSTVTITLADAIAIAEAELPDGALIEAELTPDEGPFYEVILFDAGHAREVLIDTNSGAVLEVGTDDDDKPAPTCTIAATPAEAIARVEAELGGIAVNFSHDNEDCELDVEVFISALGVAPILREAAVIADGTVVVDDPDDVDEPGDEDEDDGQD